jgi:hypothetical protein
MELVRIPRLPSAENTLLIITAKSQELLEMGRELTEHEVKWMP